MRWQGVVEQVSRAWRVTATGPGVPEPGVPEPSVGESPEGAHDRATGGAPGAAERPVVVIEAGTSVDVTTGLGDRTAFLHQLHRLGHEAPHHGAIIYIDLDAFTDVDRAVGRAGADLVLAEVAGRIRGCVRSSDTVSRIGGDEFAVVCPGLSSSREALAVAERIVGQLSRPLTIGGTEVRPTASVGVAVALGPSEVDLAVLRADAALYQAKALGPGIAQIAGR